MSESKNPIPEGFHTVTAHLTIDGAANYIDFLKNAFNAVELSRADGPGGKIMHAQVRIGDSFLMLNDYFPEFGANAFGKGAYPFTLHLYVKDADAAFAQATNAGCKVSMPLADQFWGDRYGVVDDPFGFRWSIATHKEDVAPADLEARVSKMFSAGK
ncbi:MAG TPA: VOC family protein [Blastocatellia bacterium]|nr:VOC family protein [Blastocatellia bacterium]